MGSGKVSCRPGTSGDDRVSGSGQGEIDRRIVRVEVDAVTRRELVRARLGS